MKAMVPTEVADMQQWQGLSSSQADTAETYKDRWHLTSSLARSQDL